ncbi:MAG: putative DNA-binding domain-containing protein [Parasphingorhabdus sp.]|nr:putative DNA-binding domain-containing protein [Parasphingorhabdus sp.]
MPSLSEGQKAFATCLQRGPGALPAQLFAQSAERALLGMKAHANTISHARLTALEATFPKVDAHLGREAFNRLSRQYVELPAPMAASINEIGTLFPPFLAKQNVDPATLDLASIELAWLEAYRAADADALTLADIAALEQEQLLALSVRLHPSARVVPLSAPLAAEMEELAGSQPAALLIVRPAAEVFLHPLDTKTAALISLLEKATTIGNLLSGLAEPNTKKLIWHRCWH